MAIIYLSLGSNVGNPIENVKRAIELLRNNPHIANLRSSRFYKTSPVGYKDQDWFINAVVKCETDLPPHKLLMVCQGIEKELGRVRAIKWGPRTIDADILFYGEEVINTEKLTIPHPQLYLRKFVLVPPVELNKDFFHPIFKKTVTQLLEELMTDDVVIPIPELL